MNVQIDVVDNFFNEDKLNDILNEFPNNLDKIATGEIIK